MKMGFDVGGWNKRRKVIMDNVIENLKSVQREFNKVLLRLSREPDLIVTVSVTDHSITDLDGNKMRQQIEVKTSLTRKIL